MKTIRMQNGDFVRVTKTRESSSGATYSFEDWDFIKDEEAVIQRLRNRLKLFAREWFLDESEGIDWISVFDKPFSIRRMETEIYNSLNKDEIIESIKSIEIKPDFKDRSIRIDLSVKANSEIIYFTEEMSD